MVVIIIIKNIFIFKVVAARRNGDKLAGLVQEIQSKGDEHKLCIIIDFNQSTNFKKATLW
jgi:short-subunit dehydrogenase